MFLCLYYTVSVCRENTHHKCVWIQCIWDDFIKEFEGAVLDTHNYLMTPDLTLFTERNAEVYTNYLRALGQKVNAAARRIPSIVGEWNAQNQADGIDDMTPDEKKALYLTVSNEFQKSMEDALGWFYWSWKIQGEAHRDSIVDNAGRAVRNGYLKF